MMLMMLTPEGVGPRARKLAKNDRGLQNSKCEEHLQGALVCDITALFGAHLTALSELKWPHSLRFCGGPPLSQAPSPTL